MEKEELQRRIDNKNKQIEKLNKKIEKYENIFKRICIYDWWSNCINKRRICS